MRRHRLRLVLLSLHLHLSLSHWWRLTRRMRLRLLLRRYARPFGYGCLGVSARRGHPPPVVAAGPSGDAVDVHVGFQLARECGMNSEAFDPPVRQLASCPRRPFVARKFSCELPRHLESMLHKPFRSDIPAPPARLRQPICSRSQEGNNVLRRRQGAAVVPR